jgi:hypothetical protein
MVEAGPFRGEAGLFPVDAGCAVGGGGVRGGVATAAAVAAGLENSRAPARSVPTPAAAAVGKVGAEEGSALLLLLLLLLLLAGSATRSSGEVL